MSTVRVMRLRLFGSLIVLLAACHEPTVVPPDAIQYGIHDLDLNVPCDVRWNPTGATPQYCEEACKQKPVDPPCGGKTPCNDQDACANARDGDKVADCPATFVATDYMGTHRGCCLIRVETREPVPSFFECPPQ